MHKFSAILKQNKTILLIILVAFVVRLIAINQSLWLDESIGAIVARNLSYSDIVGKFMLVDNHPPLYYLLLKFWTGLFGYSEIAIRFPSILFGLGTVFAVYLAAQELNENKNFALVASALIAFSSYFIYYSQEARMYVMAGFFSSTALLGILKIAKVNNSKDISKKWWFVFSISVTALIFTDYMPVFLYPVIAAPLFYNKGKNWWKAYIVCFTPLIFFGVMWLNTFLQQSANGQWLLTKLPAWKNVAGGATFKQLALLWTKFVFGRISLTNKSLYYSLVMLSSLPIMSALLFFIRNKLFANKVIFFWLVTPIFLGFITSLWFPAFIYFRYVYVLPAFILVITAGLFSIRNNRVRNLLIIGILATNVVSWVIYTSDSSQQREDWKNATNFVETQVNKNDIVLFDYPEPISPYRWYSKGLTEASGATDSISADPIKTTQRTANLVTGKQGVYYFEYLRELTDPGRVVEKTLDIEGFRPQKVYNFNGVGLITYYSK